MKKYLSRISLIKKFNKSKKHTRKHNSKKKFKAGALFSGKKTHLNPCSKGSFLKQSCSKGLECVAVEDKYKHEKEGKIYDGYCAAKGTQPEAIINELKLNSCQEVDCGEHGRCSVQEEGNDMKTMCDCSDGYSGEKCETPPNPCLNSPPMDHGRCINENGTARYECLDGYTGERCEIPPDPCLNFDCGDHGKCVNENGIAKCDCEDGYRGERCEFEPVTVESRGYSSEVAEALKGPAAGEDLTNTGRMGAHMRNVRNSMVAMESGLSKEQWAEVARLREEAAKKDTTRIEKFCPPSTEKDPSTGKPIGHPCKRCCSWESQPQPLSAEYKRCKDEGVANACKSEYTFEELSHIEPMDARRENLELRLSDEEFQEKFGMDKATWQNSKEWKRRPILEKLKIFGGYKKTRRNIKRKNKRKTKLFKKKKY